MNCVNLTQLTISNLMLTIVLLQTINQCESKIERMIRKKKVKITRGDTELCGSGKIKIKFKVLNLPFILTLADELATTCFVSRCIVRHRYDGNRSLYSENWQIYTHLVRTG